MRGGRFPGVRPREGGPEGGRIIAGSWGVGKAVTLGGGGRAFLGDSWVRFSVGKKLLLVGQTRLPPKIKKNN